MFSVSWQLPLADFPNAMCEHGFFLLTVLMEVVVRVNFTDSAYFGNTYMLNTFCMKLCINIL